MLLSTGAETPRDAGLDGAPPKGTSPVDAQKSPLRARIVLSGIVVLMVASAAFVWEPWPFTSFRLFSHLRTDEQTRWEAAVIDAEGEFRAYPLSSADNGLRGFAFAMSEFETASTERQGQMCTTWIEASREIIGVDATSLRVYQRRWKLSDRVGDRSRLGARELRYVCRPNGDVRVTDGGS